MQTRILRNVNIAVMADNRCSRGGSLVKRILKIFWAYSWRCSSLRRLRKKRTCEDFGTISIPFMLLFKTRKLRARILKRS
jgi:hypothetical protein